MQVPRCRHIKTNGLICRSPALAGEDRCFFHHHCRLRHQPFARQNSAQLRLSEGPNAAAPATLPPIPVAQLEDPESIQLAISVVTNAIITGAIELDRARLVLYGLQLASANIVKTKIEPSTHFDAYARSTVKSAPSEQDEHGGQTEPEELAILGYKVDLKANSTPVTIDPDSISDDTIDILTKFMRRHC